MTIERSQGKARPSLPRSRDLHPVRESAREPNRNRDAAGRFAVGNAASIGRGAKAAVRRLLGRDVEITDAAALAVARDAERLFAATVRELPNDGSTVRQLAALYARHVSLAAWWAARASVAGLGTDEGIAAQAHASTHGVRGERLAVTMLDVATKLAATKAKSGSSITALQQRFIRPAQGAPSRVLPGPPAASATLRASDASDGQPDASKGALVTHPTDTDFGGDS